MTRPIFFLCLLVFQTGLPAQATPARALGAAQTSGPCKLAPEDVFAAARTRYEANMDTWRDAVRSAIHASKAPVEEVDVQLRAFRERGEVPASLTKLRADLARVRNDLLGAYDLYARAVRSTDEPRSSAIVAEKAVWKQARDAVSWSELGRDEITKLNERAADCRINEEHSLELPVIFDGGYRMSVRGQRTGASSVRLLLPCSKDNPALDLVCNDDRFDVMVTVSPEGLVIVDGGAIARAKPRTDYASNEDSEGETTSPVLAFTAGSIRIESLRWKPFLSVSASDTLPLTTDGMAGSAAAPFGRELVVNGGNESPIRSDGSILGWSMRSGSWHRGNPGTKAYGGRGGYFSSSNHKKGVQAPSQTEIYQDIDLSKFALLIDTGVVRADIAFVQQSFKQRPGDTGRVLLKLLDGAGNELQGGYDSGEVCSLAEWKEFAGGFPVTKGARVARLVLQSNRKRGSKHQESNDAHFDNVSLKLRKP